VRVREVRSEKELGWSDASELMFKSSSVDPWRVQGAG